MSDRRRTDAAADVRPDDVWRVTTSSGHQLHALEWSARTHDAGTGPDVLLVHGLASNARLWGDVAVRLAAAGHRVVAYDQRGHGHSERAGDGFVWDGVVADLVDVAAALELGRPVVVGQSWGGNVVLEAAARAPEVVGAVATVDGGFFDLQAQFSDVDEAWAALTPPPLDRIGYDELSARMGRRFDGWPSSALVAQLANVTRTPDGRARPALRRRDHEQVVRAMWEQRPAVTAARIGTPVLLGPCRTSGSDPDDRAASVSAVAEALTDGRVHWFEDADHDVHAQRPGEVAAVVSDAITTGFLRPGPATGPTG